MVVSYTRHQDGSFVHDFIQYVGELTCDADTAYWTIPLSVDDGELEE